MLTSSRKTLRSCAVSLAAVGLLSLALAGPAAAVTGGAGTIAASEAEEGADLAFSPARWGGATWYGPGFYGHQTACGQTLRPGTIGVAHRSLPCGTAVRFTYHGRSVLARVIDRGPYAKGVSWDLTNGAREAIGFEGSGRIRYAVALQYARR
jgi:rare lipoprotein A